MIPHDNQTKTTSVAATAVTPPKLLLQQEMFQLGFASNSGTHCSGSNPSESIDNCVARCIQGALDQLQTSEQGASQAATTEIKWTVVWGPGVAVIPLAADADHDDSGDGEVYGPWATNVMFVARKEGTLEDTYFVSIAGTNSKSFFDAMEDFRAHEMFVWPHLTGKPAQVPLISLGFRKGLEVLERMKPANGLPGADQTLDEYFAEATRSSKRPVHIITGGHSQGGALSPLVALWLRDTRDKWDPNGRVGDRISCWPFAGPTPGNEAFAIYYDDHVPLTFSVINPLDVATKFFNEQDLGEIPSLYSSASDPDSNIPLSPALRKLLITVRELVRGKGYTRIPRDQTRVFKLNSTVDTSQYPSQTNPCCNFAFQMGHQHLYAYFLALGLEKPEALLIDQFTGLCGKDVKCILPPPKAQANC